MMDVKSMAQLAAEGKTPEVLFWVGCAGSFDDRAKKITRAFAKILNNAGVDYAILGKEESCTGDPAKRAGNEFLFQMQAFSNIQVMNAYNVKRIVTACPHCFNTLEKDYRDMGFEVEVQTYTVFLEELISSGRLKIDSRELTCTYHDSCQ